MKSIGISYGVIADKISKQLDEQGFKYDIEKIKTFERQREAINTLIFGDLLIRSNVDKILPKLHKRICQHVAKKNRLGKIFK